MGFSFYAIIYLPMQLDLSQITGEFLVKDEDGNFKIWRKGELVPLKHESTRAREDESAKSAAELVHKPNNTAVKPAQTGLEQINAGAAITDPQPAAASIVNQKRPRPKETNTIQNQPTSSSQLPAAISHQIKDRVTKTEGASFYFSPEDEQEVERFRKSLSETPQMANIIDEMAKAVIKEYEQSCERKKQALYLQEDVRGRLERVIASRLRNIRDIVQTKDALIRPKVEGGIGLEQEQADKLMRIIEQQRKKVDVGEVEIEQTANSKQQIAEGGVGVVQERREVDVYRDTPVQEKDQPKAPAKKQFTRTRTQSKKSVSDVKTKAKLVGPIDELKNITVREWRTFGSDIKTRVDKIRDKIDIIAEDSVSERVKAIKAWKSSPLYRLYLNIGAMSMEQGNTLDQVLSGMVGQKKETLTKEEFDAIADLNRTLAF